MTLSALAAEARTRRKGRAPYRIGMRQRLTLHLWGPAGETHTVELPDRSGLVPALTQWAREIGCPVGELDYRINDGLRVLGESSARSRHIDVCGLPRQK